MRESHENGFLSDVSYFGFALLVVATYSISMTLSTAPLIAVTSSSQFYMSAALPFFFSDLLTNVAFILPGMSALIERRQLMITTAVLMVIGAMSVLLAIVGSLSGILIVVVATICGVGSAIAFLWWAQCLIQLTPWKLCFYVAIGLVMQQAVKVVVVSGALASLPYIALIASIFSMGCLIFCCSKIYNKRWKEFRKEYSRVVTTTCSDLDDCKGKEESISGRIHFRVAIKELIFRLWKPLVGSLICALIAGFSMDKDYTGSEVTIYGQLVSLGLMIACVMLLIAFRKSIVVSVIPQFLLPVATALLLVAPFLMVTSNDFLTALVSPLNALGFFSFDVLLWVCTLLVAPQIPMATSRVVAIVQTACAFAMILGLVLAPYVEGSLVQVVCLLLLAAYLLAFTLSATILNKRSQHDEAHGNGDIAKTIEQSDKEASVNSSDLFREKLQVVAAQTGLSPREIEVFLYLARGHGSAYIAETLMVSPDTVKTHTKRIYRKLGITTREELLALVGKYY